MFSVYNVKSVSRGHYMSWGNGDNVVRVSTTRRGRVGIEFVVYDEVVMVKLRAMQKPEGTYILGRENISLRTRTVDSRTSGTELYIPRVDKFQCGSIAFESFSLRNHYISTVFGQDDLHLRSPESGLDASWVLEEPVRPD